MEKPIKIICFAGLRKYFGHEVSINIDTESPYSVIIEKLVDLKPDAKEILSSCRIAVNEKFISPGEKPLMNETVYLIPPSSGG